MYKCAGIDNTNQVAGFCQCSLNGVVDYMRLIPEGHNWRNNKMSLPLTVHFLARTPSSRTRRAHVMLQLING